MLVELGIKSKKIYEVEFERIFLQETRNYYREESNHLIVQLSCYQFIQKAQTRLREELNRLLYYLDSSSENALINTFLDEFIQTHAATLLDMENSGLVAMLREGKIEEIELMFDLFSKVPGALVLLKQKLQLFIIDEGNKLVQDQRLKQDEFV